MDFFDLFPATPPQFPGERSARTAADEAASAVGLAILPILSFLVVLFTGLAAHITLVLVVMPVLAGALTFFVGRLLSARIGHLLLAGFGSVAACFVGNAVALLLAALGSFYSTF